jgi:hypothetical protein
MTILGTSKLTVISKQSTPSKDGTQTYFKLGVLVGSEAGMLSCNEDIFKTAETGKTYEAETAYNDTYKTFRLNRLLTSVK